MVKFILIKSPDEWATTKQACRDELVVYLFFSSIYTSLYFYVLSTVLRKSSFILNIYIYIYRERERFSNECRKTKTKVITLANQKGRRQSSKPIKTRSNTRSQHKAQENVHARATIGFSFTSGWLKKWPENFEPITE